MADIVIFYELPERELNNANLLKSNLEEEVIFLILKIMGTIEKLFNAFYIKYF